MHKIFSLRIRGFQKSVIALSLSLVSTSLFADAAEKICPLPIGLQASTGVSKEAINAKITNISKSALQLKIPKATPDNEWLTSLMLEISDEVYEITLHCGQKFMRHTVLKSASSNNNIKTK